MTIVGSIFGAFIIGFVIWFVWKRKQQKKAAMLAKGDQQLLEPYKNGPSAERSMDDGSVGKYEDARRYG